MPDWLVVEIINAAADFARNILSAPALHHRRKRLESINTAIAHLFQALHLLAGFQQVIRAQHDALFVGELMSRARIRYAREMHQADVIHVYATGEILFGAFVQVMMEGIQHDVKRHAGLSDKLLRQRGGAQ